MAVKTICSDRLSRIHSSCADYAAGDWDGDWSFNECEDVDEFDYLDHACGAGYIKIHDRTNGDVFWIASAEIDTVLIADELSDLI